MAKRRELVGEQKFRYAYETDLLSAEDRKIAAAAISKILTLEDAEALVDADIAKAKRKKDYQFVWSLAGQSSAAVPGLRFRLLCYRGVKVCLIYERRVVHEQLDTMVPLAEGRLVRPNPWVIISLLDRKQAQPDRVLKEQLRSEEQKSKRLDTVRAGVFRAFERTESDLHNLREKVRVAVLECFCVATSLQRTFPASKKARDSRRKLERAICCELLGGELSWPQLGAKPWKDGMCIIGGMEPPAGAKLGTIAKVDRPALLFDGDVLSPASVWLYERKQRSTRRK